MKALGLEREYVSDYVSGVKCSRGKQRLFHNVQDTSRIVVDVYSGIDLSMQIRKLSGNVGESVPPQIVCLDSRTSAYVHGCPE